MLIGRRRGIFSGRDNVKDQLISVFRGLIGDRSGAVAVEYVVIASAITLAIIPGFYYVSSAVNGLMTSIADFVMGS